MRELLMQWVPPAMQVLVLLPMGLTLIFLCMRGVRLLFGESEGALGEGEKQRGSGPAARAVAWVFVIALLSRFALYAVSLGFQAFSSPIQGSIHATIESLWNQWDAKHYLLLAEQGYVAEDRYGYLLLVFYPLYPLLIKVFSFVVRDGFFAALLISCLSCAGSASVLYSLVYKGFGQQKAKLAVAYLLLNPISVFLAAPYGEALFMLLTLLCIYMTHEEKYVLAGLFGALSALTRMVGLVVLGYMSIYAIYRAVKRRGEKWWKQKKLYRGLAGALLVGTGFLAYLALNYHVSGDAFRFLQYQRENWSQQFGGFWYSARVTGQQLVRDYPNSYFFGTWLPQAIYMLGICWLLMFRQKKISLAAGAYSWAYLFVALAPTWLLSGPRYMMAMVSLPLLQAVALKNKTAHWASLVLQGCLLLLCIYGYTIARILL